MTDPAVPSTSTQQTPTSVPLKPTSNYISNFQYVTTGGGVLLFLRAFNTFITHRQRGQALVGAADRIKMVAWRAAGINYVRFSQLAAQVTRDCVKNQTKKPSATLKIQRWESGKPVQQKTA